MIDGQSGDDAHARDSSTGARARELSIRTRRLCRGPARASHSRARRPREEKPECRAFSPRLTSRAGASPRIVVNDFSLQVATANGSGSQTANSVLMRSIFRMGVPVSGKNLFPSNIQGLPTWFTIRASRTGYIARKRDLDVLVLHESRDGGRGRARRARRARTSSTKRSWARERRKRSDRHVLPGPVLGAGRQGDRGARARRSSASSSST